MRTRGVEADLLWLRWVFNWASKWRTAEGRYLMRENPVRGYEAPTERNLRRPVATQERFDALRAVSDDVGMEIRWHSKRGDARSYLSELLDIAVGTGRRLSAICQLRYEDLDPERSESHPYGAITWPADTDKTGRETTVPIAPAVRAAVDRILCERAGIGAAPLFPSPSEPSVSLSRHIADKWLRKAEKLANLEPQRGSLSGTPSDGHVGDRPQGSTRAGRGECRRVEERGDGAEDLTSSQTPRLP